MSLYITVQVTKTSLHLDQIHGLTITNMDTQSYIEGRHMVQYRVTLDGENIGLIWHVPGDGALALMHKALGLVMEGQVDEDTHSQ